MMLVTSYQVTQRPAPVEDVRIVALVKSQSINKSTTTGKIYPEKSQNKALPHALNIYVAIRTLSVYDTSYSGHFIVKSLCNAQPLYQKHKHRDLKHWVWTTSSSKT